MSTEEPLLRPWCFRALEPLNIDALELVGMVRFIREDPDVEFLEPGMSEPQRSELADDTFEALELVDDGTMSAGRILLVPTGRFSALS